MVISELQQIPSTQDLSTEFEGRSQSGLLDTNMDTDFTPEHRETSVIEGTTLDYCISPDLERPVQTVFIGRSSSSDIRVLGNDISRTHVAITVERNVTTGNIEYVRIINQEPVNGTLLNGNIMDFNQAISGRSDLMDFSVIGLAPGNSLKPKLSYIIYTVGKSLQVSLTEDTKETRLKIMRAQSDREYAKELKLSLLAAAYKSGEK